MVTEIIPAEPGEFQSKLMALREGVLPHTCLRFDGLPLSPRDGARMTGLIYA
jgi:hypothetical protein